MDAVRSQDEFPVLGDSQHLALGIVEFLQPSSFPTDQGVQNFLEEFAVTQFVVSKR